MNDEKHTLQLTGVDGRAIAVCYQHVEYHHSGLTAAHTSARLPVECLTLFGATGEVEVGELTPEERAWVEAESEHIDFGEVAA